MKKIFNFFGLRGSLIIGLIVLSFLGYFAIQFNQKVIIPIKNYPIVKKELDSTKIAVKDTLQSIKKSNDDSLRVTKKRIAKINDLEGDLKIAKSQIAELQYNLNHCGRDYRVIIRGLRDSCDCGKKRFLGLF